MGLICPFCGSRSESAPLVRQKGFLQKTVNLEAGRPTVTLALARMNEILQDAAARKITVLTLIHGYGSSGKGGVIRQECRKILDYMQSSGRIDGYVPGEEFSDRSNRVKALLGRYPRLKKDRNLNKGNKGITLVFLK